MNHSHLNKLGTIFKLSASIYAPIPVHGGLIHSMWRLDTAKASYAIKQLSKDINLKDEFILKNYNLSEDIATKFISQNIPAISAIKSDKKYLHIIDDVGYLVYPWIEASATKLVSDEQAIKIAMILAQMHRINLQTPLIIKPEFIIHQANKITELFTKANLINLDKILIANESYMNSILFLKKNLVISHGDLDPKNVLWDINNNFYIIDWESARFINPTYEIINTSLDFCSIGAAFNQELFIKMIKAYGDINKNEIEYAFYGVLGNWIDWLVYNIKRSLSDDSNIKKLGADQVQQTMIVILDLMQIMPKLIYTLKCLDL